MTGRGVRAKNLWRVVDERMGRADLPLLAVSIHHGVVPRASLTDDQPRADDLSSYKVVQQNDLVINRMRAFQGAVGLSPVLGIVSPDYLVLRSRAANPRYLHHLLRSHWMVGEMTARLRGIGSSEQGNVRTPRINAEELGEIRVSLPSSTDQRRIAEYLDAATSAIGRLVRMRERQLALVDERFEAEVFTAITRGVAEPKELRASPLVWATQLPSNWTTPAVSHNFELQLGKMLNAEAASGADQYPYVRNFNVHWDRFELDDLPTMHFSAEDRRRCELRSGDVLVCEGGEVGRSAVWEAQLEDCYFQKAIHRVRPRRGANSRYLMYCLRAAAKRSVFEVQGNTSTIVHLTGEQLRSHRFPWPPAWEQAAIVRELDSSAERVQALRGRLEHQIRLLDERSRALVTAAVTGHLDIAAEIAEHAS